MREFGLLTLGTRLKRLGERVQAGTQEIMSRHDLPIAAGQFPYLAALDRLGSVGIGDLSQALGVAQPGVTRTIGQLAGLGLVEVAAPDGDQRRKIVTLSREGRRLVDVAKAEIWPRIERAVADLCGEHGSDLLAQLSSIEEGLSERSLAQRADLAELGR